MDSTNFRNFETLLVIQSYKTSDMQRQREIDHCIASNLKIKFSEIIVIGNRRPETHENMRISFIYSENRLSFNTYLEIITSRSDRAGFSVLTNSDIELDPEILEKCREIPYSTAFCISRYEENGEIAKNPWCTQDTWVIRNQKLRQPLIQTATLALGTPGCELRFAELLYGSGFTICNPSHSVKCKHFHLNQQVHRNEERHYGAYVFTNPSTIEESIRLHPNAIGYPVYLRADEALRRIT